MSQTSSVTHRLGQYYGDFSYADIDPEDREHLHDLVVDIVACAYAGMDERKATAVTEYVKDRAGSGEATVIGTDRSVAEEHAALANTVSAHVLTYDDRHRASSTHPGSIVVPTALAVGETVEASGEEVLAAVFAGYEIVGHLGSLLLGFNTDLPRRPTPVFGPFGSAIAAGMLYNLSADELASALGYAANLGGGLSQVWADGTDEYALQNGLAAQQGIQAAQFARRGLTAAHRSLEGDYGFFKAFYGTIPDDLHDVPETIREADELLEVFGKPIPACGMVVVPVQLAEQLREELADRGLTHKDVEELAITVSGRTENIPGCSYFGPYDTPTLALMSIPFGVTSTLVLGGYSWDAWAKHHGNNRIQALADRTKIDYEDSYTKYQTDLEARFADGETVTLSATEPDPITSEDIAEKFRVNAEDLLPDADTVYDDLRHLEEVANVAAVTSRLRT